MTSDISTKRILRLIGDDRLSLHKDPSGHWCFVFDAPSAGVHETMTVNVYRLNQMPLENWVNEGVFFSTKCSFKVGFEFA